MPNLSVPDLNLFIAMSIILQQDYKIMVKLLDANRKQTDVMLNIPVQQVKLLDLAPRQWSVVVTGPKAGKVGQIKVCTLPLIPPIYIQLLRYHCRVW